MADFFAVQADPKKRDEGIRFLYRGDIVLIIRSAESAAFKEAEFKALKAFKPAGEVATDDEVRTIYEGVFADSLLVGWENLEIDGEAVPFSREKALELIRNRDANLYEFINDSASRTALFQRGQIERAAGN